MPCQAVLSSLAHHRAVQRWSSPGRYIPRVASLLEEGTALAHPSIRPAPVPQPRPRFYCAHATPPHLLTHQLLPTRPPASHPSLPSSVASAHCPAVTTTSPSRTSPNTPVLARHRPAIEQPAHWPGSTCLYQASASTPGAGPSRVPSTPCEGGPRRCRRRRRRRRRRESFVRVHTALVVRSRSFPPPRSGIIVVSLDHVEDFFGRFALQSSPFFVFLACPWSQEQPRSPRALTY